MAGRPPKEKSFANMLNIALAAKGQSGETKLREVAEVLVDKALSGESWAVNMVADRVDGKPLQAIEHSGEIGDGSSKEQRDAAFAAAIQAEAEDRKAKLN